MATGAMERETVSAHCCWAESGRSEGRAAEVSIGGALSRRGAHARDGASRWTYHGDMEIECLEGSCAWSSYLRLGAEGLR
jgi:hypothetical protein